MRHRRHIMNLQILCGKIVQQIQNGIFQLLKEVSHFYETQRIFSLYLQIRSNRCSQIQFLLVQYILCFPSMAMSSEFSLPLNFSGKISVHISPPNYMLGPRLS